MVSSSQIRERLSLFLDNQIDLEAFEDWFVRNTLNIHQSGSAAAEDLTFAIEESLSEHSSRHIGEQELRSELEQILGAENKIAEIVDAPQIIFIRSSAPALFLPIKV